MVEVGQEAPDFHSSRPGWVSPPRSPDCAAEPIVLYFYPKDDTPGCTKEACNVPGRLSPSYQARGARILGVSPDSSSSHAKFVQKFNLPIHAPCGLAEHQVCEAYGVWKEKNMYGRKSMGVERTTFVIDAKGIVRAIFPRVKVDGHSDAVLNAIDDCR